MSLSLTAHLFPVVSFHTDSGEVIRILLVKSLSDSRIHLGLYHRRHHLKELGDEMLFSIMMFKFYQKSKHKAKAAKISEQNYLILFSAITPHIPKKKKSG